MFEAVNGPVAPSGGGPQKLWKQMLKRFYTGVFQGCRAEAVECAVSSPQE